MKSLYGSKIYSAKSWWADIRMTKITNDNNFNVFHFLKYNICVWTPWIWEKNAHKNYGNGVNIFKRISWCNKGNNPISQPSSRNVIPHLRHLMKLVSSNDWLIWGGGVTPYRQYSNHVTAGNKFQNNIVGIAISCRFSLLKHHVNKYTYNEDE